MGDERATLKGIVSTNVGRSAWSAKAIIAGLVVEIIVLLLFSRDRSWIETASLIVSNIIIAGGVWGEIHFDHAAGVAATRLQQISDEKVAAAEARAAEANQKAQEAILELARLNAPRDLTQKQRGRIVDKLKEFSGTEYDISVSSIDPEILNFVFIVELILSTAGLTELDWQWPLTAQVLTREGRPFINLSASVTNVLIGVHVNQPPKHFECALALSNALMAEGVDATAKRLIVGPGSSTNANAIHIFIGRKM